MKWPAMSHNDLVLTVHSTPLSPASFTLILLWHSTFGRWSSAHTPLLIGERLCLEWGGLNAACLLLLAGLKMWFSIAIGQFCLKFTALSIQIWPSFQFSVVQVFKE
jgi:hypothetical protein